MATEQYPVNLTTMNYIQDPDDKVYWDIFVDLELVKRYPIDQPLAIWISGESYCVDELAELPPDLFLVDLSVQDGVASISSSVQNRVGLGIEDYRDIQRIHTWNLDCCADMKLYVTLPPSEVPTVLMGCATEFVEDCYDVTERQL